MFVVSWPKTDGRFPQNREYRTEAEALREADLLVKAGVKHAVVWELDDGDAA